MCGRHVALFIDELKTRTLRGELRVSGAELRAYHAASQQHPRENDRSTFAFVTDGIESAIAQVKAAARSKDSPSSEPQATHNSASTPGGPGYSGLTWRPLYPLLLPS